MIVRIVILAITLFYTTHLKTKVVSGRIYASVDQAFFSFENVNVIISSNKKVIDTVLTNGNGEFIVSIPDSIISDIDMHYFGVGFEENYLGHIKNIISDTTTFEVDLSKKYRKNIFGKAICLKCGKSDMVYKVVYGDAPIYTLQIDQNGDTLQSAIRNGVYQAGTCVSSAQSARWYCDRDKITY